MSERSKLTIEKPKEEDSSETRVKIFFGIFNSLFWMISIAIVGLAAWQASSSPTLFSSGAAVFTDSLIAVSCIAFIVCVLGFLASLGDHYYLAGTYVILFVLLLAVEGGLSLACYVMYPTASDVVQVAWSEATPFIKEKTETELQCCGLNSWNDTYDSLSTLSAGCISADGVVYPDGCSDAIIAYFKSPNVFASFLFILLISIFIQLLAFVGGCVFFHKLRMKRKLLVEPRLPGSRNAIVPIVVSPTAEPSSSQVAASRRDVMLNIDTPKPDQPSDKGNEALFKLASTMLEA